MTLRSSGGVSAATPIQPPATTSCIAENVIVTGAYAVLTAVFLGVFVIPHGLSGETIWVELSVARPGWEGFFYPYDSSRRLMSAPFHLAYLISHQSYLPLHWINGIYLWLTGVLTWRLVRRLLPEAPTLAAWAGALALTHGADRLIGFMPILQVRQSVVATLLAILLLLRGWQTGRVTLLLAAMGAQAVALWTYEPAIPMLFVAPVFLLRRHMTPRRTALWAAGWWAVPSLYVSLVLYRLMVAGEQSYQATRLVRRSVPEMIVTLGSFVADGLMFWRWPSRWWDTVATLCHADVVAVTWIPLAVGLVTAAAAGAYLRRFHAPAAPEAFTRRLVDAGWRMALLLLAAYLPFLLVGNISAPTPPPGPWRVHFFAAPALGFFLAAAGFLLYDTRHAARQLAGGALVTLVLACGLSAALMADLQAGRTWTEYRRTLVAIRDAAPRLRDDTFVALFGMPSAPESSVCPDAPAGDPFLDTMWFNSGLQLLYPNTQLAGSYWRTDGSMSGAVRYRFDADAVRLDRTAVTVEGERFDYSHVVAFRFDAVQGAQLLDHLPTDVVPSPAAAAYAPRQRILPGPPADDSVSHFAP